MSKKHLLTKKEASQLEFAVEKMDIVAVVCTAWETSFAHNWTNLKVVAEHGWGPLNYNCLKHPELQLMKTT